MIILGLNAYHGDAAACVVIDGRLVAAAEEERFRRIKHWAGFPSEAARYCLLEAGVGLRDVEHVAVNSSPTASLFMKVKHTLSKKPNLNFLVDRAKSQAKRLSVASELRSAFPHESVNCKVHRVEHHLSHLASAFLVSPFSEASVISVDGFGDFASAAWGVGAGSDIRIEKRVYFPHSLGIFYQAMTQYLGFPHYGDEYKVMGLAPYGNPHHLQEIRKIVRPERDGSFRLDTTFFRHESEAVPYQWDGGSPQVGTLYSAALEDLLGPARRPAEELTQYHRDLAYSTQAVYEEVFFHILNSNFQRHKLDGVTLAGGCAMNSVANGKVFRRSQFRRLYVQSAAGDAGGAIGAAMYTWHRLAQGSKTQVNDGPVVLKGDSITGRYVMEHAYLGPGETDTQIGDTIRLKAAIIEAEDCEVDEILDEEELCALTASEIAQGAVVGWFQGRMEWGPRALGNRSIVCDPRRADMKQILNQKIKRREGFRPFAPSVLKEHVNEWFEEDGDVPFMMQVYQIRGSKRAIIPAVTHVDGSGRLQTVYQGTNPRYWRLISSFMKISGVPMVLNTSFNENEPVVCKSAEALDCFLRTKMDVLVMGNHFIRRKR